MNNTNNKRIYKKWSKTYDKFFGSNYFNNQRKLEIELLKLTSKDKILFIGVGTGEDLKFVPKDASVTAIDITEEMLDVARKKAIDLGMKNIEIINMDAMNLSFSDNEFDYVILNLILSVVPDGNKCFNEAFRVLKTKGRIAIFDKFAKENGSKGKMKLLLNKITMALGTDINRKFTDISKNKNFKLIEMKKSLFGGMYRIIVLEKESES
jgi:phosphatidylethanolamine/phosphatidyl-N-methylethanolamine N-methyltransferase